MLIYGLALFFLTSIAVMIETEERIEEFSITERFFLFFSLYLGARQKQPGPGLNLAPANILSGFGC